jgi:hypothetical protein
MIHDDLGLTGFFNIFLQLFFMHEEICIEKLSP